MPVTNYYTANGQIIAEATSGVRTDYLLDALGSVTATVNQSGAIVNTYRHKPYGGLLAKTGVGSDPAFLWVGSQGYRQTGKKYSEVYIRARHYDTNRGRWNTKDSIGLGNRYFNPYQGASSNPISLLLFLFPCPLFGNYKLVTVTCYGDLDPRQFPGKEVGVIAYCKECQREKDKCKPRDGDCAHDQKKPVCGVAQYATIVEPYTFKVIKECRVCDKGQGHGGLDVYVPGPDKACVKKWKTGLYCVKCR